MDKNIEQAVLSGKRKQRLLYLWIGIVLVIGGVFVLRSITNTTVYASEITTSLVDRGNIENTINASGEVLPEFEEVISSPLAASIQKVLLDGGRQIKAGQSILT
ncbi:hypothetical protein [Pedobacter sp. N36a]|uniref:hypothetical protein n=1 Tax=Pedobacter sp. N36a TaxID=2767996 RepID=UPI001CA3B06B|nr:hypothetical protein [Pedobacter sp. N36a]